MSEARNTQMVKDAYAAFLRGDLATILEMLDDHVQWQAVIGAEGVMKSGGLRQGKPAVRVFFGDVADTVRFERFEPREYVAQGALVVALGHYTGSSKETGRPFDADWVMTFRFANGKVVGFSEFTDSAQLVRAFSPAPVAASA
jgi:ketosteroid isomerase-like protein